MLIKLNLFGWQGKVKDVVVSCLSPRPSPTMFLKAMVRLLSNTLEIVHFIKMQPLNPALDLTEHIVMMEGLSVSLFEHVAYHSAKVSHL